MAPSASPPFLDRELDGTVLLEELATLRRGNVSQDALDECGRAMDDLDGMDPSEAADQLRAVALSDFEGSPALAQLLARWAVRLRKPGDVPILQVHLRKLALTAALLHALWQATARLNPRRRT